MTNLDLAAGLFRQAEARFKHLSLAMKEGNYAYTIRLAQECVELSLKALLLSAGVEPPKWHDVGKILRDHASRFPTLTEEQVKELAHISARLRADRERSMYGDEETGIPADQLYTDYDATVAAVWAEKVQNLCRALLKGAGAVGPEGPAPEGGKDGER